MAVMSLLLGGQTLVLTSVAGAIIGIYWITNMIFRHDAREPPLVPQSPPIIGHMVGMARRNFDYSVDLSKRVDAPIFTMSLPILNTKLYVLAKPELIQQIQKQHKALAFPSIAANFANILCGLSREARAILASNVHGDDEDRASLSEDLFDGIHTALKAGPGLNDMNRVMLNETMKMLDELEPAEGESRTFAMNAWLRDTVTVATARAVYGPMNPYNDKAVVDAFWEFETGLVPIITGILPSITARKPIAARDRVATAFQAYYKAGGINQASCLAQNRYRAKVKNSLPLPDIARFEVGQSLATLFNTVPTAFWALFFLYAHPGLLEDIRTEIDACVDTATLNDGTTVKSLNIGTLRETCPLLLSAYQETLRHRSMGTSIREVMQDTLLDNGRWLLKRGAMLQIPSRVIHLDESLWGPSARDFEPRRFLPEEKKNRPRAGDMCFRAFGGGLTLCPGRHFATNEVLAVVAIFATRFDMVPVGEDGGSGVWALPTADKTNVASAIMEPDFDIVVRVSRRQTRETEKDVKWTVGLGGFEKVVDMVTEGFEV